MKLKQILTIVLIVASVIYFTINSIKNEMNKIENNYETAENDPLNTRIYTLENGLTVYLSEYKDAPRIKTNIAVRAGSKNDPSDATGLAHYLEHMLFKGTDVYGSLDYEKEKPLLDKIEALYEEYRSFEMTDTLNRERIWSQIDSVSGEAAKFAIANEYDKMVSGIGAKGTNAYTSNEKTVYVNDIPSNQIEKWLQLEAERFRNPIFRLFHTELEAVYEEKNRGLDSDGRKMFEALMSGLFQKHQYGTQTTIGTIEHLKNPSLTEIRKYFNKYYVPNNMALCLSGDFDSDEVIKLIEKYWGDFERKDNPDFEVLTEDEILEPRVSEVWGPEAERLYLGFRLPGANTEESLMLTMMDMVLSNNTAGLIDLNLNQKQKLMGGGSFPYVLKDYSVHGFYGAPIEGQLLEEVKDLLLAEIENVKNGNFPDWLIEAIISDLKLEQIKKYESNAGRADEFVDAFILDISWKDHQSELERISSITKQDVMDFAKTNYSDNYTAVYKRTGEDKSVLKVTKPAITPVSVNRKDQSEFLVKLLDKKVSNIDPVFLDFENDIKTTFVNEVEIFYKENTENERFKLNYILDMGKSHNNKIGLAVSYLKYLGTENMSPNQKQEEFYKLGCDLSVNSSSEKVQVTLSGLSVNFEESVKLFEDILANAVADEEALESLKQSIIKQRNDNKKNKQVILFSAMRSFAKYGATSAFTNLLSQEELNNVSSDELLDVIHNLTSYKHRVLYYGPYTLEEVSTSISELHRNTENLKDIPEGLNFEELETNNTTVYIVDYDMKQAEVMFLSKGNDLNISEIPLIKFHNEYFGGGMSSIVFQEMRESKALAYSVYSTYTIPSKLDDAHYLMSYVGTQSDKLIDAMDGMLELLSIMPVAETNMENAREGIVQKIRTERLTKSQVLSEFEKANKMGIDYDIRKDLYSQVQDFTMNDLQNFHQSHINTENKVIMILGSKDELDLESIKKYGEIKFLSLEEVFGY
ncbi:MAG: insulinase family protein [Flavobacteriales bacterium]|jgi:predicted Zn-dependent peptidase|nr:insulinase family protein [Flavobacteriales bacterium]MBT7481186.1 insulinase family protein [Flavobacteriales bacterium]